MRGFGLATKITVPFVLLFAALLAALGYVLAREIFQEIEARVEQEQRFALSVAAHPQLPLYVDYLRQVRAQAGRGAVAGVRPEFVVLEEQGPPVTTLDRHEPAQAAALDALAAQARERGAFPGLGQTEGAEAANSTRRQLAGQQYLVLYTTRWSGGRRQDFFLLCPVAAIEEAKDRALTRLLWTGVLGVLLAAVLGALVARWISRPVRQLAAAAGRLATGGLKEPVAPGLVSSRDEIGELSRAFEAMVESLRRSQAELVKAERLAVTGQLAASVAHEIRNPLTGLRMTVEVLAAKGGDPATREAYAVLLSELDRLALTVEELLTFARPRPPQRVPADLNRLAAEALAFLERQFQHAKIETRLEPDPALPANLPLDPNKLRQLLFNLLLNAAQAMARGGHLTVRTRWDADHRVARLEVSDTGPGIPEEVRGRIFEPFVSTKPGGGGLGLAIAKQIATEHGGMISYETGPEGTTFRVELPEATER